MPGWSRYPGRFVIILLVASALFLTLEAINGRLWLNDFRVYYDSARALLNGDPVYGVAHGLSSGYFKYAPAMAMAYAPLAALPYPAAAALQFALIVLAFVGAATRCDRLSRMGILPGAEPRYAVLFITTLLVGANLHRELHLGNINILLVWLLLLGADGLLAGRDRFAGVLFGMAMLAKPHFVILLPWLFLRWRPQVLLGSAMALAAGLLLPLPFLGVERFTQLNGEWLAAMAGHNASLIYHGGDAYNAVDTAYSFVHRAVLKHVPGITDAVSVALVLGAAALLGLLLLLRDRRKEQREPVAARNLLMEFCLLLACVPSLTLTDSNHFLFAMPLILVVVLHLLAGALPRWFVVLAVPVLVLHGGNWADALGPLSDRMVHYGVLGMANLGLIALGAALLFLRPLNLERHVVSTPKPLP